MEIPKCKNVLLSKGTNFNLTSWKGRFYNKATKYRCPKLILQQSPIKLLWLVWLKAWARQLLPGSNLNPRLMKSTAWSAAGPRQQMAGSNQTCPKTWVMWKPFCVKFWINIFVAHFHTLYEQRSARIQSNFTLLYPGTVCRNAGSDQLIMEYSQ